MNLKNYIQSINNQREMNSKVIKDSRWIKVGSSVLHLFLYVALLTLISVAASAQCDDVNLACNNSINVSTNDACIAELCYDLMLENFYAGFTDSDYVLSLTDENDNPLTGTILLSDGCIQINDAHVGMKLKASVALPVCGTSCWGYINVEDKVGPRFMNCDAGAQYGLGESDVTCEDFVNGIGIVTPVISPTCTTVNVTHSDESSGIQCTGIYSGSIIRTWSATDASGNVSTCQQRFNILKFHVNQVTFPEDSIHYLNASCDYPDTSPEGMGFPIGVQCPNIMYSYTDIGTETCGGQEKFLRDWFVIDWCTGENRTEGQVIKVLDTIPPVATCPQDTVYFKAIGSSCSAKVVLDPYAVRDSSSAPAFVEDCSAPYTLVVEYLKAIPGTNQPTAGPYLPVAMDSDSLFAIPQLVEQAVWVRYCFTDDCGNGNQIDDNDHYLTEPDYINCCFFEIQVSDNLYPTAICEGFTKISLGPDGHSEVLAQTFDDHSFDACGSIIDYEAKRVDTHTCGGGTAFSDKVRFCCTDLGDTVDILLKVLDDDGNSSICSGRVCVADPTIPVLNCPLDVTINCDDDYKDTALIGNATGIDGCNVTFSVGTNEFDLSDYDISCRVGDILRTIKITSNAGNLLRTCNQNIHVDATGGSATLEPGDYTQPPNAMVDVCTPYSIHPDILGYPSTTKQFGCINIGISWEDSNPVTSTQPGICYTIIRTWLIVDWCRYDSGYPGNHSITFTQNITVKNSGQPLLTCPDMQMVSADGSTCRADIDLNAIVIDACSQGSLTTWQIDIDSDSSIDLSGSGTSASGNYPVGEHIATFTAYNECQGTPSNCSFPFIIKGDRAPLPICLSSITWTLSENGTAVVWAEDFDLKSIGGCEGSDTLIFSFVSPLDPDYPQTSMSFGCSDIPNGRAETITLIVYIIDESGNYESCTVNLDLQDSNDVCPNIGSRSTIGGYIKTEANEAIENVMVNLDNMSSVSSAMKMTTPSGTYAFEDVDYNQDYMVLPEHNVNPLNGISTLDLVMIQRHILGIQQLDSPYKLIAADINNDHKVNGLDLIQLQKLILGIYTEFPQNDSWTFVSDSYSFADPAYPWGYDKDFSIEDLLVSTMDVDFTAVKIGDVNNTALASRKTVTSRSRSNFYLSAQDENFSKGDLVSVPFVIEEEASIYGMQFTLEFDHENLVFEGLDGASVNISDENFALLNNHDGVITFSISNPQGLDFEKDETLFTAYFEAKSIGQLSKMVDLSSQVVDSEVYTTDGEIKNVDYIFRANKTLAGESIELFQNQPNPFTDNTSIAFYLPYGQQVSLTIFGAEGKILWKGSEYFDKGISNFDLSSDLLKSDGILLYRLDTEKSSLTRKMIYIR